MEAAAVLLRRLTIVVALNLWLLWGVDGKVRANCQLAKIISLAFKKSTVYGMVIMKERNEHEQTTFHESMQYTKQHTPLPPLRRESQILHSLSLQNRHTPWLIHHITLIQINTALRFLQEKLLHLLLVSFHINIS